jgi:hypothetical protein
MFVLVLACGAAIACSERTSSVDPIDGGDEDFSCPVTAPTACPDPPLHYPDVAPIFTRRCVSCHYGAVNGPWPLLQYSHAADWNDVIRDMLFACEMPPPESGVMMTAAERVAILTWVLCGFPE